MNPGSVFSTAILALSLVSGTANAGVVDPDCTAKKAARSTAMKTTVGVSGRCTAKEAAGDTARVAVGIEEKGPVEKRRDDYSEGLGKKVLNH
ncbi:MAG: hypothetical protein LJE91_09385 [Gammaproteobacteria bacterium]|jgi:hypothetical protein|nr:hypothetical protein [Gammaproteobacteria bacterium]